MESVLYVKSQVKVSSDDIRGFLSDLANLEDWMIRTLGLVIALAAGAGTTSAEPSRQDIDRAAAHAMAATGAQGLAIAVIENGQTTSVSAYGIRNAGRDPLTVDTVMYGASLTKAVVAYAMLQMRDQGSLDLDRPLADLLDRPLPSYGDPETIDRYADYSALGEDDRWRRITPRMVLTHSTGFANFGFLEPDEKLHIHFEPGSRYAYSGDGFILLQFALETGRDCDLGDYVQQRVFTPLGMTTTSLSWRPDFAGNLADGWDADGNPVAHDERSRARAAGSMDTTITDFARFASAFVRGEGLSAGSHAELLKPQLSITTRGQFPTLQPELPPAQRRPDLSAGLGVVTFTGPQGPGFYKGGHDDITANTWVCLEQGQRCVVILSNDVRAERAFPYLVRTLLGETGVPYDWEYGPEDPL